MTARSCRSYVTSLDEMETCMNAIFNILECIDITIDDDMLANAKIAAYMSN